MLQEKIQNEIKKALKEKDRVRLTTLRGLLAAFTNELVALKRKPNEILDDEQALVVVNREAKKRKDSIDQFLKGGRNDLAEDERSELEILKTYLPEQMSMDKIKEIVAKKKEELGINDKNQMGVLMGTIMKELKGKADGGDVKNAVEESFN